MGTLNSELHCLSKIRLILRDFRSIRTFKLDRLEHTVRIGTTSFRIPAVQASGTLISLARLPGPINFRALRFHLALLEYPFRNYQESHP
jgi:hypothetical protein